MRFARDEGLHRGGLPQDRGGRRPENHEARGSERARSGRNENESGLYSAPLETLEPLMTKLFLTLALAFSALAQNAAVFPLTVPTTAQLGVSTNRAETTLTTGINSSVKIGR